MICRTPGGAGLCENWARTPGRAGESSRREHRRNGRAFDTHFDTAGCVPGGRSGGFGMYPKETTSTGWFNAFAIWLTMHGMAKPKA